jgi:phosphate acetyltransferase
MAWIDSIKSQIKNKNIKIVFPEAEDLRILTASETIKKEKLGIPLLIGNPEKIHSIAKENNIDISEIEIINPSSSPLKEKFIENYYELRKHKGISPQTAEKIILDTLFFGAMLVAEKKADCYVAGCANSTANVLRAAIPIIKPEKGTKTISSSTIHILNNTSIGENGIMFFSDTGVIPEPDTEQLSDIAVSAGKKWEKIIKTPAKVAMLSFSTKGSAQHPLVNKIVKATALAKQKAPEMLIDGEMQLDAAVIPEIGKYKAKQNPVAGQANILIFPDLNSGNIAYKLIERLGNTIAYGPILQGMSKPCSDLSRGCSAQDIIDVSAIVIAECLEN